MREVYDTKRIGGETFILAEHLDDTVSAVVAAFEYRAGGVLCRTEFVEDVIYIWIGPPRQRQVRQLPGEHIRRDRPFSKISKTRLIGKQAPTARSHARHLKEARRA